MKNKNLYIFLLLISFSFLSSQIYIPYRKGDKFGVSDENGKMIIPAQFDKIEIGYHNDFTGININGKTVKTSYILNGKIIIKDTDFTYFENEGDFIIGVLVKNRESYMFSNGKPDYLTQNLYDKNGKPLLGRSYNNIIVIDKDRDEKPALTGTALLLLYSAENRYSLYQYDNKQKKIIKTFFENSYDVDTDYEVFPKTFSIVYQLPESTAKKKLIIDFENGKIKSSRTEEAEQRNSDRFGESYYGMPPPMEGVKEPRKNPEKEIEKITYADTFQRYTEPEIPEKIQFTVKNNTSEEYAYMKKENGKKGYFLTRDNKYLVPPKYDEIMIADGHGVFSSGFIVKNGENYQYLVFTNKEQEFITPSSKMVPFYFRRDYGKKGFHLFKMFDKDNNFFCYANQDGKLYYSK